jgi:hypothetical protein
VTPFDLAAGTVIVVALGIIAAAILVRHAIHDRYVHMTKGSP